MQEKKQIIIEKSAELFHQYGYNNTGLNVILKELQIPKGSFYNYFDSKESLAVAVVSMHIKRTEEAFESCTVNNKTIEGLKHFFEVFFMRLNKMDFKKGCPIGNLITELSDQSEAVRLELLKWIEYLEFEIYSIIKDVDLGPNKDAKSLASFIVASFEGVILKSKVEKNEQSLENFNKYIINNLLKN